MATLASYTKLVQDAVDDTSDRAKANVEQGIQDVYQEILLFTSEYLVGSTEEDITATPDQRYVTPTTDYATISNVMWKSTDNDTWRRLGDNFSETDYYEMYTNRDPSDPLLYYMNGQNIYFDVAPDNAGTIRVSGTKVQPELTGSQVSIIPDRFEGVLVAGAIAWFKAYEGLPDANEYYSTYRGPYFKQGKAGGRLRNMIDQLATKKPTIRPALFGKR